ncbi:GyrI-like domain-containing protein [Microbacterium halophytorum]|uniref:GyrI-like domain-containing protein n=1 Tax=Microbacterium halophytorum TaxID=2067568 RepID=UPI000CFBCC9A|nr:GyrI-like domain-containing protein [Microbacterium halophytorum]
MSDKLDVKTSLDGYRAAAGEFRLLELAPQRYLAVDGAGDPNTAPAYREALAALYPVAYAMKFASRRELGRDYVVPPLEGLWWADDMASFTTSRDKSRWSWTMLLLIPEWLREADAESAVAAVAAKGAPERLDDLRIEELREGLCAQTLHVGSYDDEGPVLERMHTEFLPSGGLVPTGRHHEVYLSDPRRTAPEKLRTILRQPVARV